MLKLVAPEVGGVEASDGTLASGPTRSSRAARRWSSTPSRILPSAEGAALLAMRPAARDFVADAFAHQKFIAYVESAMPLLAKAGVADEPRRRLRPPEGRPGLRGVRRHVPQAAVLGPALARPVSVCSEGRTGASGGRQPAVFPPSAGAPDSGLTPAARLRGEIGERPLFAEIVLVGIATSGYGPHGPAKPGRNGTEATSCEEGGRIPMASRRWRWYARILCGLALLPPLLWLLVVLVAPTGWARRQIVARLESRSGRRVTLDGVSVGLMGGIRLTNLQIGSPQGTTDPWLKAADIRLDFGLLEMLGGHCRPARLEVDSVEVRGPPPRRRDDRAGRPDPARAGTSGRRWTDPDARASHHRPAPSGHGRGRRRADPDPPPTAGRRGRGIRGRAAGRHRAAPRFRQWRRVPVRGPGRPDRLGPRRGGPAPRRRRGDQRRDEGPAVCRARPRRHFRRPQGADECRHLRAGPRPDLARLLPRPLRPGRRRRSTGSRSMARR